MRLLFGPRRRQLALMVVAGGCAPFIFSSCSQSKPRPPEQVVEIGTQTQLLMDDFVLESTQALERNLNPLRKHEGNPLLRPERPWEGQYTLPSTVLYDESDRLFKMWYSCLEERWNPHNRKSRSAYAFSHDGIAWERPQLGLTSYQGSRQNNLLSYPVGRVLLDRREARPSHRFKSLSYGRVKEEEPAGLLISFSADGLTWTPHPDNPLLSQPRGGGTHPGIGDTHTILGWDDHWGRYVAYMRPSSRFRDIGRSESSDFIDWRLPTPVLVPDELDPPGTQFYGMSVLRDRGIYLGLLWVYHPNSLTLDVQLAFSREGVGWRRLGRRHPILTYGLPHEFDSHILLGLKPLIVGDEIRVYYAAENEAHALTQQDLPLLTHPPAKPPESLSEQSWLERRRGFGGLAISRRDGFVSLDSGSPLGILVTKPFTLRGQKLLINADASMGRFRVEIQDSQGDSVKGLAASDSEVFRSDSLRHVASWKGKADLSSLHGEAIKVKLMMTNTKLYSFAVSDTE